MIKFECDYSKILSESELSERIRQTGHFVWLAQRASKGGWVDWPVNYNAAEFERIKQAAEKIRSDSDYLVCVGVGGSYLGFRAVVEALGGERGRTKLLFTGNSFSARDLGKVLNKIKGADFSVNVISKSGTTTETAIAFRFLRQRLVERYGAEEATRRIYVTTDDESVLQQEIAGNHYESFVIPHNIGGRFSVLTPVGMLPMAVAGIDADQLLKGAEKEREALIYTGGNATKYAVIRNALLERGFNVEVLANFEPSFKYFAEWWKQLFGESEGKDGKGIFPASVIYSTDLHSLGQYMQDGQRIVFETFVESEKIEADDVVIPIAMSDVDELNYLAGKKLDEVKHIVAQATREAHAAGGVPVMRVIMPDISEYSVGALIYFFEMACALSAFTLGVNPFNQPGVDDYKVKMFHLLGKPGYN